MVLLLFRVLISHQYQVCRVKGTVEGEGQVGGGQVGGREQGDRWREGLRGQGRGRGQGGI